MVHVSIAQDRCLLHNISNIQVSIKDNLFIEIKFPKPKRYLRTIRVVYGKVCSKEEGLLWESPPSYRRPWPISGGRSGELIIDF